MPGQEQEGGPSGGAGPPGRQCGGVARRPAHRHEATRAEALVDSRPAGWLIAGTADHDDGFRRSLAAGAAPASPSDPSRAGAIPHDRDLHKERRVVERFLAELERSRRIAARHEGTARDFPATAQLACAECPQNLA